MPNSNKKISGNVLGFDFGLRKIGTAIGQTITGHAKPLALIKATDGIPNWDDIAKLIQQWDAAALIIGMPYTLDGKHQDISFAARKFANRLHARFSLPVFTVDERLTTKAAKSELKNPDNKNIALDSMAAKIILQSWLREHLQGEDNDD